MRTVPLSQTGVQVSCMALGTLRFGTLNNLEQSAAVFHTYLDAGGRFIDTANSYNKWAKDGRGGESEQTLGRLLQSCEFREELFLASKVGWGFGDLEDGLSAATIIRSCEESLDRLGVDHLDLFLSLIHI